MDFDPQQFLGGLGGLFGGLFGHSDKPYDAAMQQYREWANKSEGTQKPFLDAGKGAIDDYQKYLQRMSGASDNYQNWLQGMQDPSQFINDKMGQYQESPWAKNLQQQSMNAGQNAASASGLMGSTPLMQQLQQNSGNISSQDQNQWLQNVLGINNQYGQGQADLNRMYGQGQQNLMQGGQGAANALATMYGQMGSNMGQASYGQEAGKNQDRNNIFGGLGSLIGSFFL